MLIATPAGLNPRFIRAIDLAGELLSRELGERLSGVLIGGSAGQGRARDDSDVDLFVVTDCQWFQRRRSQINGVSMDLFLNSHGEIARQMAPGGSNVVVRNFAEGFIAYDRQGFVRLLQARARSLIKKPRRSPTAEEQFTYAHRLNDRLKDFLRALAENDEVAANFCLLLLIEIGIDAHYIFSRRWQTSPKAILSDLEVSANQLHGMLTGLLRSSGTRTEKESLANQFSKVIQETIGGQGFLPSDGPRIPVKQNGARISIPASVFAPPRVSG